MSKKMQPIEIAERSKIAQLQKETAEKSNKVEWLYSGDKLDRDAYLLGKPIDKILIEKEIDKPKEDIFSNTVDLANKIREDPLFEIKKQEIEAKKKLLENPMRIKQIKAMISNDGNSDSDDDDDNYRNRRRDDRRNDRRNERNQRRRSRSSSSEEDHDRKKHKRKHEKKRYSRSKSRSKSRSRSRNRNEKNSKYGLNSRDTDYSSKRKQTDDDESFKSSKHKEIEEIKRKIERLKQIRQSDQSISQTKQTGSSHTDRNATKKMSDEEKQRRLQEMQENAKWRNDVRSSNIKKYKSDAKLEEKLEKESNTKDSQIEASNYFNTMMRDAYSSAEDRIKRNIKNVQKNQSSFESNFARKY